MTDQSTDEPPSGFRLIDDGTGRVIVVADEWDMVPIFATRGEAVAWAWRIHNGRLEYQDG